MIIEAMEKSSMSIFLQKKVALEKGEEAVLQQVGEGKDIMSICCRSFARDHNCDTIFGVIVKANMAAAEHERMTDDEIHSQMS